jgi:hypothetical protein
LGEWLEYGNHIPCLAEKQGVTVEPHVKASLLNFV